MRNPNNSTSINTLIINIIRIGLIISLYLSYIENKKLLIYTSLLALFLTSIPYLSKKIFHKNSSLTFDLSLILSIFSLFYIWEIRGVYENIIVFAFFMNFIESIAIGLFGLTICYSIFKNMNSEKNYVFISIFSFCVSSTVGTLLELLEITLDLIFKTNIHQAGMFGSVGDIIYYIVGALIVSIFSYYSLKKNKTILISESLDKFFNKYIKKNNLNKKIQEIDIIELIKSGEGNNLEFKSTLRKNLHTNQFDKNIEHSILKTINAYLNTSGGVLLIGVKDNGEIIGLNNDEFSSSDHANRHLIQLIKDHIGSEFISLININFIIINDKTIIKIETSESNTESFLKSGNDELFYTRHGSITSQLTGSSLLKYIENKFRKK